MDQRPPMMIASLAVAATTTPFWTASVAKGWPPHVMAPEAAVTPLRLLPPLSVDSDCTCTLSNAWIVLHTKFETGVHISYCTAGVRDPTNTIDNVPS